MKTQRPAESNTHKYEHLGPKQKVASETIRNSPKRSSNPNYQGGMHYSNSSFIANSIKSGSNNQKHKVTHSSQFMNNSHLQMSQQNSSALLKQFKSTESSSPLKKAQVHTTAEVT